MLLSLQAFLCIITNTNIMKKTLKKPYIKIVHLEEFDVIATSSTEVGVDFEEDVNSASKAPRRSPWGNH